MLEGNKSLVVCLSSNFLSIEFHAIRFCLSIERLGGEVSLLCLKDSELDLEARRRGIHRIHLRGRAPRRKFDLTLYLQFNEILKKRHYDHVHCYALRHAWTMSVCLRQMPQVTLTQSILREPKTLKFGVFDRLILGRIDIIYIHSNEMRRYVRSILPVPVKSIFKISQGIEIQPDSDKSMIDAYKINKNLQSNWILGVYIENDFKHVESLRKLLHCFRDLHLAKFVEDNKISGKKIILSLVSSTPWETHLLQSECLSLIKKFELEDQVVLITEIKHKSIYKFINLFIWINKSSVYEDCIIEAICNGVPVVVPRNRFHSELLSLAKMIGEDYKIQDMRELREKIIKVLMNYRVYQVSANLIGQKLYKDNGIDAFTREIGETLKSFIKKRQRFSAKRGAGALRN